MVSAISLDFFFFHMKTPNEKMCLFEYLWVIEIPLAQAGDSLETPVTQCIGK